MNEIDSFSIISKVNLDSLELNSYLGINNFSESDSNINSEINMFSSKKNNFSEFKSISDIIANHMHMNDSFPSRIDNKILFKPLTIEQLNKKEDPFKSLESICINSCEKSRENINIVINDLSSMNNNMSDYSIKNNKNNEISFICKKRKFFFTPSEENNDLRRFINNSSEQKGSNSLNKKEKQNNIKRRKYDNDLIMKKIKKRFLKDLKNKVNKNLKSEGCRKQFKYFPPLFADNLTKDINKNFLVETL